MKINAVAPICGLVFCVLLLCSCQSPRINTKPWIVDDQRIGTIETINKKWGTESDYRDLNGRLVRVENRGKNGALLPGICTVQYSYNDVGALKMEQTLNAEGLLTCNPEGFALQKYVYTSDLNGNLVVRESYFNEMLQPVLTKSGYATVWTTKDNNGQLMRSQFFDLQGKPAPSRWDGVTNVVDIHYAQLQGVTPVLCGVYFDNTGNVIERKQLSGETYESQTYEY